MKKQSGDIVIPELEEAAATFHPYHTWTPEEHAILKKYYGRVPVTRLTKFVRHSVDAIHREASRLGYTNRNDGD